MLQFTKMVDGARYSYNLENVLNLLGAVEILRLDFESDYQGFVDVDALLADGRVFSYKYDYGSCSGCDSWEAAEMDDCQIELAMQKEATIFDNRAEYDSWRQKVDSKK